MRQNFGINPEYFFNITDTVPIFPKTLNCELGNIIWTVGTAENFVNITGNFPNSLTCEQ